jgi:hypothetical protein
MSVACPFNSQTIHLSSQRVKLNSSRQAAWILSWGNQCKAVFVGGGIKKVQLGRNLMALRKRLIFSLSTWCHSQVVLQGCRVGYRQLQSGDNSMLPAISWTKTLSWEYWHYTVALSKIGNHANGCGMLPLSPDLYLRNDMKTYEHKHVFLERDVTCCTHILCPSSAPPPTHTHTHTHTHTQPLVFL